MVEMKIKLKGKQCLRHPEPGNRKRCAEKHLFSLLVMTAGIILALCVSCSINKEKETSPAGNPASTVARGAKTMAIKTARAGAVISKLIASNTYRGGKQVITWTGERTADGTAATLERLGLIERPVPLAVLERLPDHLLESLSSLEFVSPSGTTQKIVLSSLDSRWEGEIFHRLDRDRSIEVKLTGPNELIVVTLACFSSEGIGNTEAVSTTYTVYVKEDGSPLGEVSFAAAVSDILYLYGYKDWRAGWPGVFVVQALEGTHRYRFSFDREDEGSDPLMVCFFLPHYE